MRKQVLLQVLQGTADANIRFDDLRLLLTTLGFIERVKGQTRRGRDPQPAAARTIRKAVSG
jgi:hypothetical protein